MDFFDRQDQARRNTKLLIAYFVAGVAALILALYVAALLVFSGLSSRHSRYPPRYYNDQPQVAWWNPRLFGGGVALGTLAVIVMGSIFKTLELAQGGRVVATTLGGRLVSPGAADPDERRLLNVVEEMALAAGIPVPQVYVLPDEQGINAFAAGHSTSDAVVAVTEGSLKLLTRDELQGVIGHEFSHILNGDMRLNLRLMGIIFGIVCLAVIGRILLYTRGDRDSKGKNVLPLFGLALILVGWVGVFFGRLIQAAVSRQREFLADASAVQFTRNPAGLAGALKKIGGFERGSRIENPHAGEISHMFFGNGLGGSFLHMLDTHPPLAERIRAIDPSFDGDFSAVTAPLPAAMGDRRPPVAFQPASRTQPGMARLSPAIGVAAILPNTGSPTPAHIRYAQELRDSIPAQLQTEARQPLGACALIYALLLSRDEAARHKQLEELGRVAGPGVIQESLRVLPAVQQVATHARLPLVDLTLPALRHLSLTQFQQFKRGVQVLVESDEEIDLFEYVLQKIVVRHLEPQFSDARRSVIQYYALKPLVPDCAVLLSALARTGQTEPDQIQRAFQQGATVLIAAAQVELQLVTAEECDLAQLDAALNRLALAVPQIKKNVLYACALTVAADGLIQELEAELLRAIADTLDCPMPPFIAAGR